MRVLLPRSFQFAVDFGFGPLDAQFQEVTGLSVEVATEELREGGLNTTSYTLPTGGKHGTLTFKRGLAVVSPLYEWCRQAVEEFTFEPRTITVALLGEAFVPLAAWTATRAYPVKWSVSDLKATESALAIETLEVAYLSLRRVTVPL